MTVRIPWRLRVVVRRVRHRLKALVSRIRLRGRCPHWVSFRCRYRGTTGATIAISAVANHLATRTCVDTHVEVLGGYAEHLSTRVVRRSSPHDLRGDVVFVDIEQASEVLEELALAGRRTIMSCHALPDVLHGVPRDHLARNLAHCTWIHFVSEYQRGEFAEAFPNLPIEDKSFVIHNFTRRSSKRSMTGNVGLVGYLDREPKNAVEALKLAHRSDARAVQCWGSGTIAGVSDPADYPKLRMNGWTDDLRRIHESFDVLVTTSRYETFGLIVAEALSVGIPCFLSDIPVFRELYDDAPGVSFQCGQDEADVEAINALLDDAQQLRSQIVEYWKRTFDGAALLEEWERRIAMVRAGS